MRNPYIVGRWLRGPDHYGRHRLIEYLLQIDDPAVWVVGTRRMGKTSLLRQLEWITDNDPASHLVPLFWDIQGCESMEDLASELFVSVEDQAERFEALGVDVESLENRDVIRILRTLQRHLRRENKQLFLLIDEAEALINVGENDTKGLARLRKALQNGQLRTVMTATKFLMKLNELTRGWATSPFLFGFSLINLWSLDPDSARDLVLQKQSNCTIHVSGDTLEAILHHTHRHPYLIQYLCQKLFQPEGEDTGRLRAIQDEDLHPDHLLSGFFQVDFDHLSPMERQILLTVAQLTLADNETILAELPGESASRIRTLVYGMNKLGYLRQNNGFWTVGNEFLRRWVTIHYPALVQDLHSEISDQGVESLLLVGRQKELAYLQQELARWQEQLDFLLEQRNGAGESPELTAQIEFVRGKLAGVTQEIQAYHQASMAPIQV